MAGRHNFILDQGGTWRRHIILWADRDKTEPVDLTGYTARMQIRRLFADEDPEVVASLTTENDKIVITAEEGKVEWVLSDAETEELTGEYHYDLELIEPENDEVLPILKGKIKVSPETTR